LTISAKTRIALDAMGGDFAPGLIIEGAIQAVTKLNCEVTLVGHPPAIQKELERLGGKHIPFNIEASDSVVEMHESPAQACRSKPRSSIMLSAALVAQHKADAMVSAGNSGATMAAALWHLRRLPGVSRPAITTLMPTLHGFCVVTDAGANVDCKPKHLLQFAIMGSQFMKSVFDRPAPKIGILSIGEEPSKGNELTLAASELLRAHVPNFIGNIEGRDIPRGMTDVVVCDGFVGNIVLKFAEGMAESLVSLIKEEIEGHPLAKIGGLLLKSSLRKVKNRTDYAEIGGAPLLGVNGICIICHGKSNPKAIYNAIRMADGFARKGTNEHIKRELEKLHTDSDVAAAPSLSIPA
jgi:glycerol-3-phosphate acyltransferase PlsX